MIFPVVADLLLSYFVCTISILGSTQSSRGSTEKPTTPSPEENDCKDTKDDSGYARCLDLINFKSENCRPNDKLYDTEGCNKHCCFLEIELLSASTASGSTASGSTASGSTASGSTASGSTASGSTASGSTASGSTASGSTASGTQSTKSRSQYNELFCIFNGMLI